MRDEHDHITLIVEPAADSAGSGRRDQAYCVLGKGMHADRPGHGFVLIDARGTERWYGEYPSMYLSGAGLVQQVRTYLGA